MSPATCPAYRPELGDYVLVPGCALLPSVGKVVGFKGHRPVVQSVASPNVTVAVASRKCVVLEQCRDPEHPDCLISQELAIDCAQWTLKHLAKRQA